MPGDALDDLLDYRAHEKDVFRDVDTNMDIPVRRKGSPVAQPINDAFGLGIDEEIKITKKRKPIAKLDEKRLLSQGGIPKLRRIAKERLRFKGKGHEYSDIARLLNFYQLWLDDLYPRAKFADGLAIIEKLGHTKPMQTMRREWINEAKSKDYLARGPESEARARTVGETGLHEDLNLSNPNRSHDRSKTPVGNSVDDEDLYSATPRKLSDKRKEEPSGDIDESLFLSDFENDSSPSGDELDALLAEDKDRDTTTNAIEIHVTPDPQIKIKETEPTFDDEMEAMRDMW